MSPGTAAALIGRRYGRGRGEVVRVTEREPQGWKTAIPGDVEFIVKVRMVEGPARYLVDRLPAERARDDGARRAFWAHVDSTLRWHLDRPTEERA